MSQMEAPLEDLNAKREAEISVAERHRRRRDELNEETHRWMEKRDTLNGQVRELVEQAVKHRESRDTLNTEVRKAKEERDRLNRRVNELAEQLNETKRRRLPRGAIPLGKLRRELKDLEFRQMTSVLTVDKEKAIIEEMQGIRHQVVKLEKSLEADVEVKAALDGLTKAKEEAEASHARVGQLAEQAQAAHDAMQKLYEQSDGLRRDADKAQEEFIRSKMAADEEHHKHIEHVHLVHDLDKLAHGYTARTRKDEPEGAAPEPPSGRREAELIYERFRKGEKLSTEDLMTLQKSGYL